MNWWSWIEGLLYRYLGVVPYTGALYYTLQKRMVPISGQVWEALIVIIKQGTDHYTEFVEYSSVLSLL